jgi:hypothetical protein
MRRCRRARRSAVRTVRWSGAPPATDLSSSYNAAVAQSTSAVRAPPLHESADRRPPRTMEDILKVFEDDLLTAVQSVIDLIVGLIR